MSPAKTDEPIEQDYLIEGLQYGRAGRPTSLRAGALVAQRIMY